MDIYVSLIGSHRWLNSLLISTFCLFIVVPSFLHRKVDNNKKRARKDALFCIL